MGMKDINTSMASLARVGEKTKKSSSLPPDTVEYLKNWMMSPEHIAHPYPTEKEKAQIMVDTNIELKQLTNWFVNNRKRYWKPRVEARLQQQAHAQNAVTAVAAAVVAASQRCHGVPDLGLFRPCVENSMLQSDARPYGRLDINQSLPILNPSHTMSAIIPHNFLHQHLQAASALHVVSAPPNQRVITQNKNDKSTNPFSFIDTDKTLLPRRPPNNNTEQLNAQVVSMGSASSLASDSDSLSASNDEPCMVPPTSPRSNQLKQFVTFSNEQLNGSDFRSIAQSSTAADNSERGLTLSDVKNTGTVTQHERINVNILSNDKNTVPSIDNVSILLNEDPDRILKSYLDYEISYSFPVDVIDDETKIRKFRAVEIARVKNLLLQLYLCSDSPNESSGTGDYIKKEVECLDTDKPIIKRNRSYSDFAVGASSRMAENTRPRSSTFHDSSKTNFKIEESSSKKRRLFSKCTQEETEQWQNACLNARNLYDDSLPSLEEAACLFGYHRRSTTS